jgi:hypothetical protein
MKETIEIIEIVAMSIIALGLLLFLYKVLKDV